MQTQKAVSQVGGVLETWECTANGHWVERLVPLSRCGWAQGGQGRTRNLERVLRVSRGKALADRTRRHTARPGKVPDLCLVEGNRDRDLCLFR